LRWDLEQSCLRGAETVEKDRGQSEMAQGLKPSFLLWAFIGTTKQAGEKGGILERDRHQPLQGLKPDVDFIGFIGTTKVVPCYKTSRNCTGNSFSPSCKVMPCYRAHFDGVFSAV